MRFYKNVVYLFRFQLRLEGGCYASGGSCRPRPIVMQSGVDFLKVNDFVLLTSYKILSMYF